MKVEQHPKLNVCVREDGCVYLPKSGKNPAHWAYGCPSNKGHMQVGIAGKVYLVHCLIAEVFIPNPENKPQIDHINRIKTDNSVANLRWVTHSENQRNTPAHDHVTEQGRTHFYEDKKQAHREQVSRYNTEKCITHKQIRFSNGIRRWVPLSEAIELQKLPVKERVWKDQ